MSLECESDFVFSTVAVVIAFYLCTPKVQDIDFDVIDGTYSKGDEYMLFVLKDMGTIKTFQFQPIGQGYENLGLLMPYVFREPNELCEIRDDGGLRQVDASI